MKNGLLSFLMMLTVFLLGSCHKDNISTENRTTNGLVFKSTIAETAGNTQSQLLASGTEWSSNDAIGVYMSKAGQGFAANAILAANKQHVTENGGANGVFVAANSSNEINFPEDGSNVDFVAYYPYKATIADNQFPVDLSDQSSQAAIDLLYANNATGLNKTNSDVALSFKHQLSKLVFNVSSNDITDLSGVSIKIQGTKTRASFNLAGGDNALVVDETSTANILAKTSATGEIGEAIILPSAGVADRSFVFTLPSGAVYKWLIPAGSSFEKGKRYTYNVKLQKSGAGDADAVKMQVSAAVIEDWINTPSESIVASLPPVVEKVADAVVAKDGSGDYTTVQAAIDAAPTGRTSYYYIYIKNGEYKEVIEINQNKPFIYLVGQDSAQTILTYDNHSGKLKPDGTTFGTSDSRSFYVKGTNFVADNITFANTAGMTAGQALAVYIDALSSAFINCRFLGFQDTWYAHNGTRQYMKNCYIEGSVDFMFGGSKTLFDRCQIHSNRSTGYLTAASTSAGETYGYVFNKCNLTADAGITGVYLGRPWRPDAKVVYISCEMGSHIRAEGWHNWNNPANEATAYYAEYNSTGAGANPTGRVSWSHQLTDSEAANYTYAKMFGSWDPGFLGRNVRMSSN